MLEKDPRGAGVLPCRYSVYSVFCRYNCYVKVEAQLAYNKTDVVWCSTAVRSSVQDPEAKAKKLVITFDELTAALAPAGQGGAAGVRLVDVREPKEIEETGRLSGAINIPC